MPLTDAQWSDAVALAVSRFHTGVTTAEQMADEITAATQDWPTRSLSNSGLVVKISRSLASLTGLIETVGPPDPDAGTIGAMAFDNQALAFYGPKTELGWGDARPIDAGPPGPAIEMRVSGDFIQWRVEGEVSWINLIAIADLKGDKGDKGDDGEEVSLQKTATHIQWRLGTGPWQNLVALSDLVGPKGDKGDKGDQGDIGLTPDISFTASTGAPGSSASVTKSGTLEEPVFALTVPRGDVGPVGNAAWSPIYANVADGTRRVQRVVDWTGGQGTKPATGKYLGPAGLVDTAAEATDIRGASGAGTGDMLGSNNLNDVTDKAIARQNLSVWSRAEVGPVDTDYLSIVDAADPAGLSFAPTGINFAKNTGRLDYVDAASSAAVPGLTYSRTGAATAWRKDGTLAEFAPNVMRRTDAGVTIEGQRTNVVTNNAWTSVTSVPSPWSEWPGGVIEVAASKLSASIKARKFTTSASRSFITSTDATPGFALPPNTTYCFSVFVEEVTTGIPVKEVLHTGYTPSDAVITYPVCPANPSGGVNGIVQPGRLHILVTSATGGSSTQWRAGLGVLAPVSGSITLSLPQLELGTRASTPIITTGAAATVGADNLYLGGLTDVLAQPFSVVATATSADPTDPATIASVTALNTFDRVSFYRQGSGIRAQVRANNTPVTSSLAAASAPFRVAGSLSNGVLRWAVNGVLASPITAAGPFSAPLSDLRPGSRWGSAEPTNGVVTRTLLFPYALTDAELVEMTR